MTEEEQRLESARLGHGRWRLWGTYLAERAWGTVREDYSAGGNAWESFPYDHARSRAYRWNEDGLAGISDDRQILCFALALWNGNDTHLKERLFGLTNAEGNHGEDVKELYYYLDNTPTHSYAKYLYKYPHRAFPYDQLVHHGRGQQELEYELLDTGVFEGDRYCDIVVEYAKAAPDDILISISATNHGPDSAHLDLLPTLWFRNTWVWGYDSRRPSLSAAIPAIATAELTHEALIRAEHDALGTYWLICQRDETGPELLFTENDTNYARLYPGARNSTPFVKDGINNYVVADQTDAVNPELFGTKATARYRLTLQPGETKNIRLRLAVKQPQSEALDAPFEQVFAARRVEAGEEERWEGKRWGGKEE